MLNINLLTPVLVLLIGILHLMGFFRLRNVIFKNIKDKQVLKQADNIIFYSCCIISLISLANFLLSIKFDFIPYISLVYIIMALLLSIPFRAVFLFYYYNKKFDDLPSFFRLRIWH